MSAPDTKLEKQKRRHKPPLTGIPLAIGLAVLAFVGFLIWSAIADVDTSGAQNDTSADPVADEPIETGPTDG